MTKTATQVPAKATNGEILIPKDESGTLLDEGL